MVRIKPGPLNLAGNQFVVHGTQNKQTGRLAHFVGPIVAPISPISHQSANKVCIRRQTEMYLHLSGGKYHLKMNDLHI